MLRIIALEKEHEGRLVVSLVLILFSEGLNGHSSSYFFTFSDAALSFL